MMLQRSLAVVVLLALVSVSIAQGSGSQLQQLNVKVLQTATQLTHLDTTLSNEQTASAASLVEAADIADECNALGPRLTSILARIQADATQASKAGQDVQPYFDIYDYAKSVLYRVIAMRYEANLVLKGQALNADGTQKSDLYELAYITLNESQMVSDLLEHQPNVVRLLSQY